MYKNHLVGCILPHVQTMILASRHQNEKGSMKWNGHTVYIFLHAFVLLELTARNFMSLQMSHVSVFFLLPTLRQIIPWQGTTQSYVTV